MVLFLFVVGGVTQAQEQVERATFYEALFRRTQGWTGADGTYSYPLQDGSTLWSFSDTFWGPVREGRHVDFEFVNNSHVRQRGAEMEFFSVPSFVPPDRRGWFWMWDGLVEDDKFTAVLGQFDKTEDRGAFGFEQVGLWLVEATLEEEARFRDVRYTPLPFFSSGPGRLLTFGSAVFRNGDWVTIFGIRDQGLIRSSVLARAPIGALSDPELWEFWDGREWGREWEKAHPLFERASMESSVYRSRDGRLVYLGSLDTQGALAYRTAPGPEGPWSEAVTLFQPPERVGSVYCYNGKAHPHLTGEKGLLLSYNVNTTDLEEVVEKAEIYRPRFLWWRPKDQGLLP